MNQFFLAQPVTLIAVFAAVAGGFIYISHAFDKKRREGLLALAQSGGLEFAPEAGWALGEKLPASKLLSRGGAQKAFNALYRHNMGNENLFFDFKYHAGVGKYFPNTSNVFSGGDTMPRKNVVFHTVAAFKLPNRALPDFVMRPEDVMLKVASAFGCQDIDFPENPQFSSNYNLQAQNETAVRAALRPEALAFFAANRGWSVEACGGWLVLFKKRGLVSVEEYPLFMQEASGIASLLA